MKFVLWVAVLCWVITGCSVSKGYRPSHKFSAKELQEDYRVFRSTLEEDHPSLYWYTPKDSMDFYFNLGQSRLKDSMNEGQFRTVLSYVVSKMRCGHTSVRPSRAAGFPNPLVSFPLLVKAWPDTVMVVGNLARRDSIVTRGVVLTSIDGRPMNAIIDSLFSFLSTDGYNQTHKYQTLSNGSGFRNLYAAVFGLKARTPVEFIDTTGILRKAILTLYNPRADTPRRIITAPAPKPPSRRERNQYMREAMRNLRIDTVASTAFMEVATFTKGNKLRPFFRQSFRKLKELGIQNLVVDMRANGGGSVTLSNLLTKYIADRPFKIADSLYTRSRTTAYAKYRNERFFNGLFLFFLTRKKKDGKYHFGLYEGKYFKPRTKNNFNGTTYILTGGNSFSAASLFTKALRDQDDVIVVGEETGGGAYGNSAWLIPDVTLPVTGVRFRLPLFRLVIDAAERKGYGIIPEVPALPSVDAIRKGEEFKMDKVRELIRAKAN